MTLLISENQLNERPFTVVHSGTKLQGIVHSPANPNGVGLLLMPAGYKYRVGPHDYYVSIARHLVQDGYTVLRADFSGLGFSDGTFPAGPVHLARNKLEDGDYVGDVSAISAAFRKQFNLHHVLAGGICGGAIMSLMASVNSNSFIDGIVAINIPLTRSKPPGQVADAVTTAHSKNRQRKSYIAKLFSGPAWRRILSGKSNYLAMLRAWSLRKAPSVRSNHLISGFFSSWDVTEKGGIRKLLIFGGRDARWYEFSDLFFEHKLKGRLKTDTYEIQVIADANHELHFAEWQNESISHIRRFLAAYT